MKVVVMLDPDCVSRTLSPSLVRQILLSLSCPLACCTAERVLSVSASAPDG
jgi:hypothetical protein